MVKSNSVYVDMACYFLVFFFKQKTAYEMRISDWSSDVCSSDLSDDGPGLPQKARENLFKAFAGSARAGGSGLGLAIAQELVHGHGGELSLVRTGGDGTLFRPDLPAG